MKAFKTWCKIWKCQFLWFFLGGGGLFHAFNDRTVERQETGQRERGKTGADCSEDYSLCTWGVCLSHCATDHSSFYTWRVTLNVLRVFPVDKESAIFLISPASACQMKRRTHEYQSANIKPLAWSQSALYIHWKYLDTQRSHITPSAQVKKTTFKL